MRLVGGRRIAGSWLEGWRWGRGVGLWLIVGMVLRGCPLCRLDAIGFVVSQVVRRLDFELDCALLQVSSVLLLLGQQPMHRRC